MAVRVDGAPVRGHELTRLLAGEPPADPSEQLPLDAEDAHARTEVGDVLVHGEVRGQLADEEDVAQPGVGGQAARTVQIVPLREVATVRIEDLHAVVLAVGHVHESGGVGGDVVRQVEAPGVGAGLAPRHQMPAFGIVLVHAGVAVAVRDVHVARLRRDRHVRRPVEWLPALEARGLVRIADGEETLSLGRELSNRVMQVVGQPQRAVGADRDSVRPTEDAFTPRALEAPGTIEHDDRMLATIEDVHVVVGIDGDAGRLHEAHAVGQRSPLVDRAVVHRLILPQLPPFRAAPPYNRATWTSGRSRGWPRNTPGASMRWPIACWATVPTPRTPYSARSRNALPRATATRRAGRRRRGSIARCPMCVSTSCAGVAPWRR